MADDTTPFTSAGHLCWTLTQAHHDVLETMLRVGVILTPSQRQWVCKALDALRKTHFSLAYGALEVPWSP